MSSDNTLKNEDITPSVAHHNYELMSKTTFFCVKTEQQHITIGE